jgi:carboxymethylenebutenolidase
MISLGAVPFDGSELSGYRADPVGEPRGAIILIHEIWGLVDHITDVADRYAAEGYLVIAPDILSGIGVDPAVGAELQRLIFNADEKTRTDAQPLMREKLAPSHAPGYAAYAVSALIAAVDYLEAQPGVNGRIAVTGFCFGGGYSFALAAADPRVRAAIPFYGAAPDGTAIAAISCPVLAIYGRNDPRIVDGIPALTDAMQHAGVDFEAKIYENAGHAFFNDSNTTTYVPDAATDAWHRSLSFLAANLG